MLDREHRFRHFFRQFSQDQGMTSYYDEVEIEDFEWDEDSLTYFYPCPCGDRFQITKEELMSGEDVATCPSCSLILKVIYDPDQFSAESESEEAYRSAANLVPRLGASRLPEELVAMPKQLKRTRKPKAPSFKKDINDLRDEEEPIKGEKEDGSSPKKPKTEEAPVDPIEEEEFEDGDEELDMGTDYAHNYFDNGEDFLDSDNDGDEDGPVY